MDSEKRTAFLAWLDRQREVDPELRAWVASSDDPTVAACLRGDWVLWFAEVLGVDPERIEAATRPALMRGLRIHATAALAASGLEHHRAALHGLPDGVDLLAAATAAGNAAQAARRGAENCASRGGVFRRFRAAASVAGQVQEAVLLLAVEGAACSAAQEVADAARMMMKAMNDEMNLRLTLNPLSLEAERARAEQAAVDELLAVNLARRLCAADVRAVLPDLQELLDDAISAANGGPLC